ncbi:MAG TPA: CAP domain-containing protein [Thermoanaerobaculia bacterium]|nr:CAP domain-containing protein [Thermoanaerobaculia bacterium]
MKLARLGACLAASALAAGCAVHPSAAADPTEPKGSSSLRVRLPDLSSPVVDVYPKPDAAPSDPLKEAVLVRINRNRAAAGVQPVAWDDGAARVADAFCRQQVREATNGHFLTDGVPPYARTAFSGVFGAQSENSVSWVTTARSFTDSATQLALLGHDGMMAEKPPSDGHRRTILDPEATHVGVGYALEGGRFQMAQEFLTRTLERLTLSLRDPSHLVLRFEGKALSGYLLEFVTIAHEPTPASLTREQASGRTTYSYPSATLAYVGEGVSGMRVSGVDTQEKIRIWSNREFSFAFAPDRPGLYTFLFYTAVRSSEPARPGGSVTVWVEERS